MGAKLYADTATKTLVLTASPDVNGFVSLNVQEEVWSDLIIDWQGTLGLRKHTYPLVAIGGQTISAGKLGTTYLLVDPWQVDPNLSQDIEVGVDNDSQIAVYGAGAGEGVAQSGQMPYPGNIPDMHLRIRRVGTPTDSVRVSIYDSLGGAQLQTATVDGDQIPFSIPVGHGVYFGFETPADLPAGSTLYVVIERTGSRDIANYYEVAVDDANPFTGGTVWEADTGVWTEDTGKDVCMHMHVDVPYTLQVSGNLFTEDPAVPLVIPTGNVSVQQYLSTLVEVVESGTSGLTATESQALLDIDTNVDSLLTNVATLLTAQDLTNEQKEAEHITSRLTGKVILRNTRVSRRWEADAWENEAGTIPYGTNPRAGIEAVGMLVEVAWS